MRREVGTRRAIASQAELVGRYREGPRNARRHEEMLGDAGRPSGVPAGAKLRRQMLGDFRK
eukprot:8015825-Alexandrium_andersonii.AAC.1